MLTIVRSGAWEWALLFHVTGALVLVGGMVLLVVAALTAERHDSPESILTLRRLGLRTLLVVVVPAFVLMRVSAEWVRSEDAFADDVGWIGMGYVVSDLGLVVLIALTLLSWRSVRGAFANGGTRRNVAARAYTVLASVYLLALLATTWAMTTKPD